MHDGGANERRRHRHVANDANEGMMPAVMPMALLLVAVSGTAAAAAAAAGGGNGFVSGEGDTGFIELLDTARAQWSSTGTEYQSVSLLYRGDCSP